MNNSNRKPDSNPFADYLWMGEMEKFDEEVEAEIEKEFHEEEFIRSCIEQLLEEEEEQTVYYNKNRGAKNSFPEAPPNFSNNSLVNDMSNFYISQPQPSGPIPNGPIPPTLPYQFVYRGGDQALPPLPSYNIEEAQKSAASNGSSGIKSKLNPNAAPFLMNPQAQEFIPGKRFTPNTNADHFPRHMYQQNAHNSAAQPQLNGNAMPYNPVLFQPPNYVVTSR